MRICLGFQSCFQSCIPFFRKALTFPLLALLTSVAMAQSFPNKPITVIFPFPAGSLTDTALRAVSMEASKSLGQPLIYENRPGGNGRVGFTALTNSKPDGYTLVYANQGMLLLVPLSEPSLKTEVVKDYVPVTKIFEVSLILSANPSAPFRDLKGVLAFTKDKPGALNVAVVGGSVGPLVLAMIKMSVGAELTAVRYKGDTGALQDILAGRVDMYLGVPGSFKPHRDAGKLVGIAAFGPRRVGAVPDIPTAGEQGLAVSAPSWVGVIAPPGTPNDVVAKLDTAFGYALSVPEVRTRLDLVGADIANSTPEQFLASIRSETDMLIKLVRQTGIKLVE